ncbi:MAG: AAA family ATPase [Pyrinomonadaceae bacterium]
MHISKIELENIKSHHDSAFEFSHGSTAITGENGAGKTTLIEAVAWTLFDVLDYKKDDLVRRGAKKGAARVTFVSGLDERKYAVYRDTGTGYYVNDPSLGLRLAEKKEDVGRFLRQHLGVEAGTDLESLYRRAIGVPQGTFTAVFLEPAGERKRAFDKLLKVEEYRNGAEALLQTSRFVEGQIATVNVKIARDEGELGRAELIDQGYKTAEQRSASAESSLAALTTLVDEKTRVAAELDEKEKNAFAAREARDRASSEVARAEVVERHAKSNIARAREAAAKIESVREDAARYAEAVGRCKELDRERGVRDGLTRELANIEKAIATVRIEQKNVRERLENSLKAHKAVEALIPQAAEQELLESVVEKLRNEFAVASAARARLMVIVEKMERLRESYRSNLALLNEARENAVAAGNLNDLETRDTEIVQRLANLKAALERDEQFQREIKNGLCPILSQKCLNLKNGDTLEGFVSSQFSGVKTQIATLQTERTALGINLKRSRDADKSAGRLAVLELREAELKDEGTRLKDEKNGLEKEVEGIESTRRELLTAEA